MATKLNDPKNPLKSIENAFSLSMLGRKSEMGERVASLGIPQAQLSEPVFITVSALLEKLDDLQLELDQSRAQLKEIESLVDVDCVAPVPNRRAFMRRLNWVVSMHERYQHPSSILFFDLNGFKQINDIHGHAAGDLAIRHVSEILISSTRESDFLARIGGDEFAIILYYATAPDAQRRGDIIADTIRLTPFFVGGQPLTIETAVGHHAIDKGESAEVALQMADQSMYRHKRAMKAEYPT